MEAEAARRAARIAAEVLSASRLVEAAAARERRALARGGGQSAGVKRCSGDAAGDEVARPRSRTRTSQGVGASGVKRACGVDSPEGATVAAREAEEAEASRSRARSARVRRLRLDGAVGE